MAANVNTTCGAATGQGSNGPADFATYCWINFAGYDQVDASDGDGQLYTVTLLDGGSMTFRLRVTTSAASAVTAPSWSGAPFGQTAFLNVPGRPVVYQATDGSTTNVAITAITVTAGTGGQVPYAFVAADAESSNNGETLGFTTNGDPWTLLASMQNGSSTLFPSLSGLGSSTVSQTGVAGSVGARAFASAGSPTTISSVMVGSGLQGIAFGVKYLDTDAGISKVAGGSFPAGGNGSYTLTVRNNGLTNPYLAGTTFTVTDTLPAALTYISHFASGWGCSIAGQTLTCARTLGASLLPGATLPSITLNVAVATSIPASVANTANLAISGGSDGFPANNTATAVVAIVHPDLSASVKEVEDVDGGMAEPGDTLRYTIHLANSTATNAVGLRVTDTLAASLGSLTVASMPPGATNVSAGNTLDITGISLPPGGTASIVFTAVISGSATQGTIIPNTATIATSGGVTVGTAVADPVTVETAQPPATGNKYLYLNTGNALTRARPTVPSIAFAGDACFNLAPLAANLSLSNASVTVRLRVRRSGGTQARTLRVQLRKNAAGTVISNWTTTQSANVGSFTNLEWTFNLLAGNTSYVAGNYLSLCVDNSTTNRSIEYALNSTGDSHVRLNAQTVINVNSVETYSAAYGSIAQNPRYLQGQTAYIRAVVGDPFGNADITGATVRIVDAGGTQQLPATAMASVGTPNAATRVYEIPYVVPANPRVGGWTAEVIAREGQENEITHTGLGGFPVEGRVSLGKAWVSGTPGDTVTLGISGGTTTTPGSSTPASTIPATATAVASATITFTEAFTVGIAGGYSNGFSCIRDRDLVALVPGGSGMSRTITMPNDSAVTCTFTNTRNVPLTVVKSNVIHSDPVNGTSNPKAIPGAFVDYLVTIMNPSTIPIDLDTVYVSDVIPEGLALFVADLSTLGSGPVAFTNGTPSSGLTLSTSDVAFSSDGGTTWTYVPSASGDGTDSVVTGIRINPKGVFNPGNASFQLRFRARIR